MGANDRVLEPVPGGTVTGLVKPTAMVFVVASYLLSWVFWIPAVFGYRADLRIPALAANWVVAGVIIIVFGPLHLSRRTSVT